MTSPCPALPFWRAGALCLLLGAAAATAQTQPAPAKPTAATGRVSVLAGAGQGERDAVKWFNMLDADGDGRVSLDEARVAFRLRPSLKARFETTDTNHDGYLTADEIRAAAKRSRAERQARRAREKAARPDTGQLPR